MNQITKKCPFGNRYVVDDLIPLLLGEYSCCGTFYEPEIEIKVKECRMFVGRI